MWILLLKIDYKKNISVLVHAKFSSILDQQEGYLGFLKQRDPLFNSFGPSIDDINLYLIIYSLNSNIILFYSHFLNYNIRINFEY